MGLVVGRLIFEGTAEPMAQGNGCVVYKRCGCADAVTGKRLGGRCMLLDMADHGRWYFAVQTTGLTGRRERVRRGGYATKEDAAEAGAEFLAVQEDGPIGSASTTGQWLRHWLATHQGLRPTTRKSYDDHIRLYLLPYLGRIRLSELTGPDVRRMFAALVARRNRYGEPIASATLDRIRATLRASLNAAVRDGLIAVNPAKGVRLLDTRRPHAVVWTERRVALWQRTGERPAVAVWTAEQLAEFLEFVREDHLFALWWVMAVRGLRRGEAAGLRWADLDLDRRELTVTQQRVQIGRQVIVGPPKSAASRRTIALDAETIRVLRGLDRAQRAAGLSAEYVFLTADGTPLLPNYLTHRFRALVLASGLPPVRLHDLRHGAASLALAARTDLKVVQGTLGHSSIVLTADTYVSVLPVTFQQAADATARLVLTAARKTGRQVRRRAA